jgi:hypothetical protein
MNLSGNVRIVDAGETKITITSVDDRVAIAFSSAARSFDLALSKTDAEQLARALLVVTGGERPRLPQSRQIGGIIGPY